MGLYQLIAELFPYATKCVKCWTVCYVHEIIAFGSGETYVGDSQLVEVTSADTAAVTETVRVTRSRSKIGDDVKSNSSEVSDKNDQASAEGKRKRKRTSSQSEAVGSEPASKKQPPSGQGEGRQLRFVLT